MEKAASKKGVVFQAVKDVVQSLVDDSLVHVDKIGTSNWYWAFPGELSAQLCNKLAGLERELERAAGEATEMENRLAKAAKDHPQTEERQMAEVMLASATEANVVRFDICVSSLLFSFLFSFLSVPSITCIFSRKSFHLRVPAFGKGRWGAEGFKVFETCRRVRVKQDENTCEKCNDIKTLGRDKPIYKLFFPPPSPPMGVMSPLSQALRQELESFSSGDTAVMETMKEGLPVAKAGVNRWTDNVFMLKSWVEKKMGSREETNKFFKQQAEIDFNNFDYVE